VTACKYYHFAVLYTVTFFYLLKTTGRLIYRYFKLSTRERFIVLTLNLFVHVVQHSGHPTTKLYSAMLSDELC